jgi:aryl-alcohol dehydrogenase-like predicted oxidoreductase
MPSLALGTANFGSRYGISRNLSPSITEARRILSWAVGEVDELDTSLDYKGSHKVVSEFAGSFQITSKINLDHVAATVELTDRISRICDELGKDKIERVLLRPHTKDPLFTVEAIQKLRHIQSKGAIGDFGLSIYDTSELRYFSKALDSDLTFQVPLNFFNRSFQEEYASNSSVFANSRFYVRSIFLQGLLLMNPNEVPANLQDARYHIKVLRQELATLGTSVIEATMAFIKDQSWITGIVLGVNNRRNLKENIEAFHKNRNLDWSFLSDLPKVPMKIRDPRLS